MESKNGRTDAEVRSALREIFGRENSRIARKGEVRVRRRGPDGEDQGWYVLGFMRTDQLERKLWREDGSLNRRLAEAMQTSVSGGAVSEVLHSVR
ncbi:MAG: hypothetical protein KIT73_04625 [Burkholderiales bacterium]|nr:hypothetical protein [Burkholderiales bacterium]